MFDSSCGDELGLEPGRTEIEHTENQPLDRSLPIAIDGWTLSLIQEGLRGVVRIPAGAAHALDAQGFPIAVMGKTGTTNDFRDALFVGSTYGIDGVTVAVRIGFDDSRSLGAGETGGRVALPVFQELMLTLYGGGLIGRAPAFPDQMEQRITRYLQSEVPTLTARPLLSAGAAAIVIPASASSMAPR